MRWRSATISGLTRSVSNAAVGPGSTAPSPTVIAASWYVRSGVRCSSAASPAAVEAHVDDRALRRRQDHGVDELLVLAAAAVAADELHPPAADGDVEHARVGGVDEVEANDLARVGVERQARLAVDEQLVAEAAHRHIRRLGGAERRDPPVLDQDVVERHDELAVGRRPVARVPRDDEDGAGQAHLLAVVLADVRVEPVQPLVGELQPVLKALADLHRPLRLVRSVVAVVEPQPVPMHGRLEIAAVLDVDDHLRALRDLAASDRGPSRCRRASARSRRRAAS